MAQKKRWNSVENGAGHVKLSDLALPLGDAQRLDEARFRVQRGIWYELSPTEKTEVVNGVIAPVGLKIRGPARFGYLGEGLVHAALNLKNWMLETHHFKHGGTFGEIGTIALTDAVIRLGDRLSMDGHLTSPIIDAWVTEPVIPPSQTYYLSESRSHRVF